MRRGAWKGAATLLWGVACLAATGVLRAAEAPVPPEPPPPPRVPGNLITNPGFETDADRDGVPDGWYRSDPEHWAGPAEKGDRWHELHALWVKRGAVPSRIPFRPPDTLEGGRYSYQSPGRRSGRAVAIDETEDRRWGEWDTVVAGIRPNTDYVLLGWRRQSTPSGRAGAAPWLHVALFGKLIPIKGVIQRDTWVRFAVPVNSAAFEGPCRVGFVVDGAPTKVWLDDVALYEGTLEDMARFRAGLRGAVLEYPSPGTAYASPGLECPFFFELLWSFHAANGEPGLEVVFDLPEGIGLTSGECGTGLRLGPPTAKGMGVEGRPYVRRVFPVLSAEERKEFDSAGRRSVRLWLKASPRLAGDVHSAFYHVRWKGGRQPDQPLRVRVLRVDKAEQPEQLLAAVSGLSPEQARSRANILARDLPALGVNMAILTGGLSPEEAAAFREAGIRPAGWFGLVGGIEGGGAICPSAWPEEGVGAVAPEAVALLDAGATTLAVDLRTGLDWRCDCALCEQGFGAWLKEQKPDIEFAPPAELSATAEGHEALRAAWQEFRSATAAGFCRNLRRGLEEHRATAEPRLPNAEHPLRLHAVVPAPDGADPNGGLLDYVALAGVFDMLLVDPQVYEADAGGTPNWTGDGVAAVVRQVPEWTRVGAVVTPGRGRSRSSSAPSADRCHVHRQVLQAVAAGAKAVVLHPLHATDGLDLQQFSAALAVLRPFDELIAEARPTDAVSAANGGTSSVRALGAGGKALVLVSRSVDEKDGAVTLAVKVPEGEDPGDRVLVDVHRRRVVAEVPADSESVAVDVPPGGARLFYLGPAAELPIQLAGE